MADRKAELEKKRQKLEELKKAREQKKKETQDKELVTQGDDSKSKEREDVDELVSSLLGPTNPPEQPSTKLPATTVATETAGEAHVIPKKKKATKLVMDQLIGVNIRPVELEVYTKCVQTDLTLEDSLVKGAEEVTVVMPTDVHSTAEPVQPVEQLTEESTKQSDTEEHKDTKLSEEECEAMMSTNEFHQFLSRAALVMERALTDPSDIMFDCYLDDGDRELGGDKCLGAQVMCRNIFCDEKLCKGRVAMDTHWSPHHPELLLASFNAGDGDTDGLALVWNVNFRKDTPDYVFHSQSPVVSSTFAKFHPSYLIGGTLSGQVILWDMRSNRRIPVQRSPLSAQAHTHPIYCVNVVGTENAHNLITISSDGKLCSWSLDMLSQPQESMELQSRQAKAIAVSCMDFSLNDVNRFVIGSQECLAYQAVRHGSKPGVVNLFEGHAGPITSISCHNSSVQLDLSHLFLTSSFDWTVKLWSSKQQSDSLSASKSASIPPLFSFECNSDYVYDVQWCPSHPAVFGCVNGMGQLQLWDINKDSEVPVVTEDVGNTLRTMEFAPDGKMVVIGDSKGQVHIYELGEVGVVIT